MPAPPAALAVDLPAVPAFPPEGPILIGGIVAAVIVLVLAWHLFRRVRRGPGERFARTLDDHDEIAVLTHPNPDPDAMAAAMGTVAIAEERDVDATIQYPGEIRHQENRAFRTVLDLDADSIESDDELAAEAVVLVDHNEPRGFQGSEDVSPVAVVDHHPGDGTGSSFTDVRTDYGACATIYAEYFRELGFEPAPDEEATENGDGEFLPRRIATALMYGVLTDTNNLTRGCSSAEFDASEYLYRGVDADTLDRVASPPVDAAVLDTVSRAITERDVRGPFAISDVGTVENVDAISQAADQLLRLEGVTAVVALGDDGETMHLSGRSRDDRIHMGDLLESVVEEVPMSGAGGHARMGGGQVSLAHLEGLRPDSGMSREEFRECLFEALNGDA